MGVYIVSYHPVFCHSFIEAGGTHKEAHFECGVLFLLFKDGGIWYNEFMDIS